MALLLVIEPEEQTRRIIELVLLNAGYEVVAGVSCPGNLDPKLQNPMDLILCDVGFLNPADMAGISAVRKLFPAVKIVGLSATLHDNARPNELLDAPDQPDLIGILSKPFTLEGLLRAVAKALTAGGGE